MAGAAVDGLTGVHADTRFALGIESVYSFGDWRSAA